MPRDTKNATPKHHLLVVDDDGRLRQLLVKFLKEADFHVTEAQNAKEAWALLENFTFDLMVLDIMMPGETGLELTEKLRDRNHTIPILLLTAMGELEDKITGFKKGADEYLPKPFEPEELILRIHAILRRTQESTPKETLNEITFGPFHFHHKKGSLRKGETPIPLTDGEAILLRALCDEMENPISREDLMAKAHIANARTIDVQITRLRKKLEEDPKQPKYLQTIRHKGYVLWTH